MPGLLHSSSTKSIYISKRGHSTKPNSASNGIHSLLGKPLSTQSPNFPLFLTVNTFSLLQSTSRFITTGITRNLLLRARSYFLPYDQKEPAFHLFMEYQSFHMSPRPTETETEAWPSHPTTARRPPSLDNLSDIPPLTFWREILYESLCELPVLISLAGPSVRTEHIVLLWGYHYADRVGNELQAFCLTQYHFNTLEQSRFSGFRPEQRDHNEVPLAKRTRLSSSLSAKKLNREHGPQSSMPSSIPRTPR